jgi:hypothetical protein
MHRQRTFLWLPFMALALWSAIAPARSADPAPTGSAPAAAEMSPERLGELFKDLGYSAQPIRDEAGRLVGVRAERALELGDGEFRLMVKGLLTADRTTIWLKVRLSQVTDLDGVPAAVFVKMLAANRGVSPAFFVYEEASGPSDDDTCTLYLYLAVNAPSLTPSVLRSQLDFLVSRAIKTRRLWDTKLWPTGGTPAPKPAA